MGNITLEEFISIKNAPSKYYEQYLTELNQESQKMKAYKSTFKNVLKRKKDAKKMKEMQGGRKKKKFSPKDYFIEIIDKVKYENMTIKVNERPTSATDEPSKIKIRERIQKLRNFMKEKRRERLQQGNNIKGMKIYELVMALANSTLKKIERNNLVDFFDINKGTGKSQLKKYSNFSVKSKINDHRDFKLISDFDEVDKYTQMIRLEKILDQIDKGGSSYVDSVKAMFYQTSNYYFDNIRPKTPEKFKDSEYVKKLEEIQRKENARKRKLNRVKFQDSIIMDGTQP